MPSDAPNLHLPPHLESFASTELQVASSAAVAGARIILDYYHRGVSMRSKETDETYNLVSDADIESEQAIASVIGSHLPSHSILGEEEQSGDVDAENLWIVDPLDGTNNFAHRIPHFAVSVGFYQAGIAQCGIVVNPVRNDWYYAVRGEGAFHNGNPIHVNQEDKLDQTMIGCGFYYDRGAMMEATLASVHEFFKENIHGIRRFGTAALDLCQVASGLFGAFFEYQLSPWDFAAGRLILEEAGGVISDCHGHPLELKQSSLLASNKLLHTAALDIVKPNHPK